VFLAIYLSRSSFVCVSVTFCMSMSVYLASTFWSCRVLKRSSVCESMCVSVRVSVCLRVCQYFCVCLSIGPSICLSICLYLSICRVCACLHMCLCLCLCMCMHVHSSIRACVLERACTCAHVHLRVHMFVMSVYISTHMCMFTYVRVYIHICSHFTYLHFPRTKSTFETISQKSDPLRAHIYG